jgi:hypothetical protein
MNVPVAKIIAHDEDDVWLGSRSRELSGQEGTETERDLRYSRDSEFHGQLGMFLDATQSVTVAIYQDVEVLLREISIHAGGSVTREDTTMGR